MFDLNNRLCLLALAGGLSAAPTLTPALEASDLLLFSREPVALKPQLGVSQTFNDNVFYRPSNRVSDFITVLSPGLDLQVGREEQNHLSLEYEYRHFLYADHSQLNTGEHDLALRSRYVGNRLVINGQDRVQFLSGVLGGAERGLREQNVERVSFFDEYTFSYALGEKMGAYLQASHRAVDYERAVRLYDNRTLMGTAGFLFHAFPRTSFFGELYLGQTTTSPNADLPSNPRARFVGGFVGVRGQFTEKLTGMLKAGYEVREFSDDTPAPSAPVVDAALIQRFTDKTALTLAYARRHSVSVQFARQTYTADVFSAGLRQALGSTGKWQATLAGNYGRYAYERLDLEQVRRYSLFSLNAGLEYQIQLWLRAGLAYQHERLHSGGRGFVDYDVNRVTLRVAVGY